MKTQIGVFTASFNRNTKKLYTTFSSSVKTIDVTEECEQCDKSFLEQKAKESVSEWFTKISKIEEADIAEHPIELNVVEEKRYQDDTLKSMIIEIYQK